MAAALPPAVIDHIAALLADLGYEDNIGLRWEVCGTQAKDSYRVAAEQSIRLVATILGTEVPTTIASALAQRAMCLDRRTKHREKSVRQTQQANWSQRAADGYDAALFPREPAEVMKVRGAA